MSLFKKAKPAPPEITYQNVIDYLRDLGLHDYNKILKVVKIYREADKDVKKVLGIKENSVTDPATAEAIADSLINDDDTELGDFLADDIPPKKPKAKKAKAKK